MIEAFVQGERCFLDANIIIYYFAGKSQECNDLFIAMEQGFVKVYTSPFVLAEVHFKLRKGIEKMGKQYQDQESIVIDFLEWLGKQVTIIERSWEEYFYHLVRCQKKYTALLTNDALHLAAMNLENITSIISADKDFDKVRKIARIGPSDI